MFIVVEHGCVNSIVVPGSVKPMTTLKYLSLQEVVAEIGHNVLIGSYLPIRVIWLVGSTICHAKICYKESALDKTAIGDFCLASGLHGCTSDSQNS